MMIDPKNYKRGVILIEDYCDRMLLEKIFCIINRFAMQIKKDGRFVLGVLESKSIKVHHMGKGRYMLKACVEYYDEEKK